MPDKEYEYPLILHLSKKVYKSLSERITKNFRAVSGTEHEVHVVQTDAIPLVAISNRVMTADDKKKYAAQLVKCFTEQGYFNIRVEWLKKSKS